MMIIFQLYLLYSSFFTILLEFYLYCFCHRYHYVLIDEASYSCMVRRCLTKAQVTRHGRSEVWVISSFLGKPFVYLFISWYLISLFNNLCGYYLLYYYFYRHKETSRIRVLMRQEKTMKVLVNHFLDPRIVLVPNAGNDRSWCWVAFDFAEGSLVETVRLNSE